MLRLKSSNCIRDINSMSIVSVSSLVCYISSIIELQILNLIFLKIVLGFSRIRINGVIFVRRLNLKRKYLPTIKKTNLILVINRVCVCVSHLLVFRKLLEKTTIVESSFLLELANSGRECSLLSCNARSHFESLIQPRYFNNRFIFFSAQSIVRPLTRWIVQAQTVA